jgi:hypothetical protein
MARPFAAELAEPRRHLRRDLRALRQDLLELGKRDSKRRGHTWLEEIERYTPKRHKGLATEPIGKLK